VSQFRHCIADYQIVRLCSCQTQEEENGVPVQKMDINKIDVENVKQYADVRVLHQLALELNLSYLLGKHHNPHCS